MGSVVPETGNSKYGRSKKVDEKIKQNEPEKKEAKIKKKNILRKIYRKEDRYGANDEGTTMRNI